MDLTDLLLTAKECYLGWGLFILVLAYAIWRAPWQRLKQSGPLNAWLGMIVVLVFFWILKAGVQPGLSLHLVGANLLTLCFGPQLAYIALSVIIAAVALNSGTAYAAYGLNVILTAGVGVAVAQTIFLLVERYLPNHFFIYIFVTTFFGSAVNIVAITLVGSVYLIISGIYPSDYLFSEYQPYTILLGFSEAWLTGMAMTLLVVYRPDWVSSFDDARYLTNK